MLIKTLTKRFVRKHLKIFEQFFVLPCEELRQLILLKLKDFQYSLTKNLNPEFLPIK